MEFSPDEDAKQNQSKERRQIPATRGELPVRFYQGGTLNANAPFASYVPGERKSNSSDNGLEESGFPALVVDGEIGSTSSSEGDHSVKDDSSVDSDGTGPPPLTRRNESSDDSDDDKVNPNTHDESDDDGPMPVTRPVDRILDSSDSDSNALPAPSRQRETQAPASAVQNTGQEGRNRRKRPKKKGGASRLKGK
jgi:hypothetical protein